MSKIVGIGANVYDMLIELPFYPEEDTKLKINFMRPSGGGPCATGLVAASKLGADSAFIGNVTDDSVGEFLISDFKKYGVKTEYINAVGGCSPFTSYVILSKASASRTIIFDRGTLPAYNLDKKAEEAVKNAEILMIDGNETAAAISACKIAKQSGTKILYDAGGLYDGVEDLIPFADILIPSEEFALGFTKCGDAKSAAKKLYDMYDNEAVVITCGKNGGVYCTGGDVLQYPAFEVCAVDSNGSGDVFHGAYSFAALNKMPHGEACIFSSAVSALKCTKTGSREGVPFLEETIKFLKERGYNEFEKNLG